MNLQLILFSILGVLLLLFFAVVFAIRRHEKVSNALNMVHLSIKQPKRESKDEKDFDSRQDFKQTISVMEQMLSSMHSIYRRGFMGFLFGQPTFTLEYVVQNNLIHFYVVVPKKFYILFEKQITAYYPDAYVERVPDYNIFAENAKVHQANLILQENYVYPIKTYTNLESDPINNLCNVLSKISNEEGAVIQLLLKPVGSKNNKKVFKAANRIQKGKKGLRINPLEIIGNVFSVLVNGPDEEINKGNNDKESDIEDQDKVKFMQEKAKKQMYKTVVRIITTAPSKIEAQTQNINIQSAFSQYNDPSLNQFVRKKLTHKAHLLRSYMFRVDMFSLLDGKNIYLNTEEISSLYHFPSILYNKTPTIDWLAYKIAPAPSGIPTEGLYLGYNLYRGQKTPIFMTNTDRFRHFYVIGQTGTGKSSVFKNMIYQDLEAGRGICVVDPHGDLVENILEYIPKSRAEDVVYFNPGDTERPMGLNLLEGDTPEEQDFIALEAMNIMIKLYGEEIFSPRLQDYFRNACLTLMEDQEEGGAITDVVRLFTDETWQKYKVAKVKNPIVNSFWNKQMAATGAREKQEMIPYFAAKFGAFVTNTLMRNVIGQVKSSFNFADIMNNNKILLVNLSKGQVGDLNAQLLGMIIVSKLQVAAMRRAHQPEAERNDFFLYIDEFQNFVTDSIESILSEARKYRLSLNMAHQYINQLVKGQDAKIRDAVFGNVGTMMSYKISAQDSEYMGKEMAPVFTDQDLINLDAFKGVMKLSVNNKPTQAFSINVIPPWENPYKSNKRLAEALKQLSRLKYGRDKEFVTREILARIGA